MTFRAGARRHFGVVHAFLENTQFDLTEMLSSIYQNMLRLSFCSEEAAAATVFAGFFTNYHFVSIDLREKLGMNMQNFAKM